MNILWLKSAERDFDDLVNYIAEDNPQSSVRIFHTIAKCIERLSRYPSLGREGRVEQTRELIIPQLPFIVVYTVTKEIRILAILHTSRKWPHTFPSL